MIATSPNSPCPSFSSTRSCSLGNWHNGVFSSSSSSSVAVVRISGLTGAPYVEDTLVPWAMFNCGTINGGGDKGGGGGGGCGGAWNQSQWLWLPNNLLIKFKKLQQFAMCSKEHVCSILPINIYYNQNHSQSFHRTKNLRSWTEILH